MAEKDSSKGQKNGGDNDDTDLENEDTDEEELPAFSLKESGKLSMFTFLFYLLLRSDVFVMRVLSRVGGDLVSGQTPTKKGIVAEGIMLVIAIISLHFLITKEIL